MRHTQDCLAQGARRLRFMLVILPAIALGVPAMIANGVSPALWGQQLAAFVVFSLLLALPGRWAFQLPSGAAVCLCLAALAGPLFFPAVGGVRRWLDLGLFHVNAAMLVLPSLLWLLAGMDRPYPALLAAAAALCLQPDFSQLTALLIGALPILWRKREQGYRPAAVLMMLSVLAVRCCTVPTALEPAAHSEGILALLGGLSPLMQAAGWLALALIPASFALEFARCGETGALCLAAYYAAVILFSLTGEYPVPFMGFGLSPIAGYALSGLLKAKPEKARV